MPVESWAIEDSELCHGGILIVSDQKLCPEQKQLLRVWEKVSSPKWFHGLM